MADVRTARAGETAATTSRHTVTRRRGLPTGRAVVGGFLVALAAVGVFAAYSSATAGPTTQYVVAARDLSPGDQISEDDVTLVAIDLPDEQRQRSYDVVSPLVDATVIEPLVAGELIQEGSLIATGAEEGTRTVSFAVEPARAVNATLKTGERVDVLATFGSGDRACTHVVAGDVAIVGVSETTGSLVGQSGGLTITIAVPTAEAGVAVAHAAAAGTVTLVRTTHADAADVNRFCTPTADAAAVPAGG